MKKTLFLSLIALLVFGASQAQCPTGITFTSQGQVDSFSINYPNCTEILGDVNFFTTDEITNLNGLSQVSSIEGSLVLPNDEGLTNLSGLEGLEYIGITLFIVNCNYLEDISGLANLAEIGGNLKISTNLSLPNLDGLENLNTIGGNLDILSNTSLTNINGLSSLTNVAEGISISNNPALLNLAGLGALNSFSGLGIANNSSLVSLMDLSANDIILTTGLDIVANPVLLNLDGLESITNIGEGINLMNNTNLQSITGLENLIAIGEELNIAGNHQLNSLSGLNELLSIGDDFILKGDGILNLAGLESLQSIGDTWAVDANNLESFTGIGPLDSIGGNFVIQTTAIENFIGLESLTYIGGMIFINDNPLLTNFTGLNNLNIIGGDFNLVNNDILTSLLELESLDSVGGNFNSEVNPELTDCHLAVFCELLLTGNVTSIVANGSGCESLQDMLDVCYPGTDHLIGQVVADFDLDCQPNVGDEGLENWVVNAQNDEYNISVSTDNDGYYSLPLVEGEWTVNVMPVSTFWSSCFIDSIIISNQASDTIITDFLMGPEADCPFVDWDVTWSPIRICNSTNFVISYCNYGTQPAGDHVFSVMLDTFLTIINASIPYTVEPSGLILFEVDTLEVFECDQIILTAMVDCDSVELSDVLCLDVGLNPTDLCSTNTLWDSSTVVANGYCLNDSIFFELENIGSGDMIQEAQFKVDIVIDDIVLLNDIDVYQLESEEIKTVGYAIDEMTMGMQLRTDQLPGHPVAEPVAVVVPNCDDPNNNVVLTLLPTSNSGNPFMETYCGVVTGAYDPNIKTAIPTGTGPNHEIDKDWKLDYTIQFQNTGNDTAFLVVLKDTLSENVDLSTLKVKGSSHNYTWELNPNRELVITYENILLVDSFTNEPGSHGFVQFEIMPQADLIPGDIIENRVGIYFDFNDPVITNTVLHTIRKPVVGSSEHLPWCEGDLYLGQAIWQDTTVQLLTEFVEYDSIHFIHFDVALVTEDSLETEVVIGDYFQGMLIESDTVFTISYIDQNGCDSLLTYSISVLTSIRELDAFASVEVFPNPTSDHLFVLKHQGVEAQQWKLVNHLGKPIWENILKPFEELSSISMRELPTGVYFLHVKTDRSTKAWRIVKQ